MTLLKVVATFEDELERRWPGILQPKPPATTKQIGRAERIHGVELSPDVIQLAQRHNGCWGYPLRHGHLPLVDDPSEVWGRVPLPYMGGPFDVRSTVPVFVDGIGDVLCAPQIGEHTGEVYRMSVDAHYLSGRAALCLEEIFETWHRLVSADLLVLNRWETLILTVSGSEFHTAGGRRIPDILAEFDPGLNPLCVRPEYLDDVTRQEAQDESGMDPRMGLLHDQVTG